MRHKNLGTIHVSLILIEDHLDLIIDVFSSIRFLPITATHHFTSMSIEYTGVSPAFPTLNEGQQVPVYLLRLTKGETGLVKIDILNDSADGGLIFTHILKKTAKEPVSK